MSSILNVTEGVQPFGPLVEVDPIYPPAVKFFAYCQDRCKKQFHQDFMPFMQEQMSQQPALPSVFLPACKYSPVHFYATVLWLLQQDFSCDFTKFMTHFICPIFHRLPEDMKSLLKPFMHADVLAGETTGSVHTSAAPPLPEQGTHVTTSGPAVPMPPNLHTGTTAAQNPVESGATGPFTAAPPSPLTFGAFSPVSAPLTAPTGSGVPPVTAPPAAPSGSGASLVSAPPATPSGSGAHTSEGNVFDEIMATHKDVPMPSYGMTPSSQLMPQGPPERQPAPVPNTAGAGPSSSPHVTYETTSVWDALQKQQQLLEAMFTPDQVKALKLAGLFPSAPASAATTATAAAAATVAASLPATLPAASAALGTASATSQVSTQTSCSVFGYNSALAMPFMPRTEPTAVSINARLSLPPPAAAIPGSSLTLTPPTLSGTSIPSFFQPFTVVQARDPPSFNGFLDNKKIPDLQIWYRRIESHCDATKQHIRDVLDRCTEGIANQLIQQLYIQQITDPSVIKSMFFNHFSHLIKKNSEKAFHDLMFGPGVKMDKEEVMEAYISQFRLALFEADIKETELLPNSSMVRSLVHIFLKGLPEILAKELRLTKDGNEYSTLQELFEAALFSGKKHTKKKALQAALSNKEPSSAPPSKKQKTGSQKSPATQAPASDKKSHNKTSHPPPKPPYSGKYSSGTQDKGKQAAVPSSSTQHKSSPSGLLHKALNTLSR